MGNRELFLWVALPHGESGRIAAAHRSHRWRGARSRRGRHAARTSRACASSPYKIPTPWIANFYFRIDSDIVARLGGAADLRIEAVDQTRRGPVDLNTSAEPGADPRLAEFAAR